MGILLMIWVGETAAPHAVFTPRGSAATVQGDVMEDDTGKQTRVFQAGLSDFFFFKKIQILLSLSDSETPGRESR